MGKGNTKIICKNDKGEIVSKFTSKIYAPSTLIAETLALREVLSSVINLKLECVVFESDFMELIESCKGNLVRREIEHIAKEIQKLKQGFTSVGFIWSSREGNCVPDLIAKLFASFSLPRNWGNHASSIVSVIDLRGATL